MDKSQADVVAQAILEPSLKEQAEDRQLRERRAQRTAAHGVRPCTSLSATWWVSLLATLGSVESRCTG